MPDNNEREQIREENLNWLLELHNNLNTGEDYQKIAFEEPLDVAKSFYTLTVDEKTKQPVIKPVFEYHNTPDVYQVADKLRDLSKTGNLFVNRKKNAAENENDFYQVISEFDTETPMVCPVPKTPQDVENLPFESKGFFAAIGNFFSKIFQYFSKSQEKRVQHHKDIKAFKEFEKAAIDGGLSLDEAAKTNEKYSDATYEASTKGLQEAVKGGLGLINDMLKEGKSKKEVDDEIGQNLRTLMANSNFRENFEDFLLTLNDDLKEQAVRQYRKLEEYEELHNSDRTKVTAEWLKKTQISESIQLQANEYTDKLNKLTSNVRTLGMSISMDQDIIESASKHPTVSYERILNIACLAEYINSHKEDLENSSTDYSNAEISDNITSYDYYNQFMENSNKEFSKYKEPMKQWLDNQNPEAFCELASEHIKTMSDALQKCKPGSQMETTICFVLQEFFEEIKDSGKDLHLSQKINQRCIQKIGTEQYEQMLGKKALVESSMKCIDAKIKLLDQQVKNYSLQVEKSLLLNAIVGEGLKQTLDNAYDKGTQNKLYSAFGKSPNELANIAEKISKTEAFQKMAKLNRLNIAKIIHTNPESLSQIFNASMKEIKQAELQNNTVQNQNTNVAQNELNTQKTEPAKSPASIGGMH